MIVDTEYSRAAVDLLTKGKAEPRLPPRVANKKLNDILAINSS